MTFTQFSHAINFNLSKKKFTKFISQNPSNFHRFLFFLSINSNDMREKLVMSK